MSISRSRPSLPFFAAFEEAIHFNELSESPKNALFSLRQYASDLTSEMPQEQVLCLEWKLKSHLPIFPAGPTLLH